MATIQQSFAFVNARFFSLIDQVQAGTLSSVSILNSAGSAVVAKIVSKTAFDTANTLGGSTVRVTVPQLPYGMTPQRIGYNGLYKMVKQLRDDNATVDSGIKATFNWVVGPGNVLFTAKASGTGGNGISVVVVNPGVLTAATTVAAVGPIVTITLRFNVSILATLAEVAAAVVAANVPITALAGGTTSTLAVALGSTLLTGGTNGVGAHFIAYDVTRTLRASTQAGLAPSSPVRAVMIPKALADQLSL